MEDYINEKGHMVAKMTAQETMKLGGVGICGSCNSINQTGLDGHYIAALNDWFCNGCYEEWAERSEFYQEDVQFEQANMKRVKELFIT